MRSLGRQPVARSIPLPLRRFPLARARSFEEACQRYASLHVPVQAERIGRGSSFRWEVNRVEVDRIALLSTRYGGALRASGPTSIDYYITVALASRGRLRQVGAAAPLAPRQHAVVVSPDRPVTFELDDRYAGIQVVIPRNVLDRTYHALCGVAPRRTLQFESALPLTSGAGASLAALVGFVLDQADRDHGMLASPVVASDLVESLLHAFLLQLPHDHVAQLHAASRGVGPSYLRRAEEYLAANVAQPITSVELAAAVGVSVRGIQAAFRTHRGTTPTGFLRERRLELARRCLLSGAHRTVADVAFSCGFTHLGRFSGDYRSRFGELPSETLAAATPPRGVRDLRIPDRPATHRG